MKKKEVLAATALSSPEELRVASRTCATRKKRLTKSAIREPRLNQIVNVSEIFLLHLEVKISYTEN
ncbi:MAG: hypothetical protein H7A38_07265 [Chlamydiales bacterium]|nr:hypothetical protein [Chlamydiales bacterium]